MQRILVVEDDFDIQELLQNFLQEAGYEVAVANDGVEALSLFAGERYDLIVLDIMLPKIDGYGVCELIRKQSDVPIIMLTALSGEEDQIKGLDLQVDDYITKPFSMPVLLRKIAAVLRRSNRGTDEKYQIITYGNLRLNCDGYTATVDGTNFELTQKEFEIRFGIVMLFHYINEEHIDSLLAYADLFKHEAYYARMAMAWMISICFIKFPQKTMKYLQQSKLDDWTYNKAIQKTIESLRINKETKDTLRTMKRR